MCEAQEIARGVKSLQAELELRSLVENVYRDFLKEREGRRCIIGGVRKGIVRDPVSW